MRVVRLCLALAMTAGLMGIVACGQGDSKELPDFCSQLNAQTFGDKHQRGSSMPERALSLTFDDGPAEITSELSTYLRDQGIQATFFINGQNIVGREDVVQQLVADGHLLGNHTQTHTALSTLTAAEVVAEVEQTDELIASLVPNGKLYFRPPFGDWNGAVQQALTSSTMNKYVGPVGWDIGEALTADTAADWDCWDEQNGTRTVDECAALYTKEIQAKKRGIVLLHDGPPLGNGGQTLEMTRKLVPALKAQGYKFVRVDEVTLTTHAGTGPGGGGEGGGVGGPGGAGGAGGGRRGSTTTSGDPCRR